MQKECYGKYRPEPDAECAVCKLRGYCRRARHGDRLQSEFTGAGEYVELVPSIDPPIEPEPEEPRVYSHDEMIQLTRFFIDLSPVDFVLLKLRITRPELQIKEIAAMVPMSTAYVSKFYRRITADHPALEPLIYDRLTK